MSIGLVLSGGGARGISHLGVIKALQEAGIEPSIISGSSAGAILGAFIAYGYSPDEVLEIVTKTNLYRIIRPAMSWKGLLSIDNSEEIFKAYFPENSFESLKIPLIVAATNVKRGKTKYFKKGELIRPLLASSCIPVLFHPLEIKGKTYIDGGVLNNMPVEPLIGHCERLIGVHCNPIDKDYKPSNMKALLERTMMMTVNFNAYSRMDKCDFFLEAPDLCHFNVFDFKKSKEIFDIGYHYTKDYIARNESFLEELLSVEA